MTRFKTKEEFQAFLDTSTFCICGRLCTGLHEMNCPRIRKEWQRLDRKKEIRNEML